MQVPQLLLHTLEDLIDDDLKTFKWHLTDVLEGNQRIPKSHLQSLHRTDTVTKMIQTYGGGRAVNITVEILREMGKNKDADMLQKAYDEERAATPSASSPASAPTAAPAPPAPPAAAPTAISANNGSVVFAPMFNNSTFGSWTTTFNK